MPHPNLVPVSPSSSRKYQSNGIDGSPSKWRSSPLTCKVTILSSTSDMKLRRRAWHRSGTSHKDLVRRYRWLPPDRAVGAVASQDLRLPAAHDCFLIARAVGETDGADDTGGAGSCGRPV